MVKYGAKTISEGGCFAVPKLYHDGLMLIGESAGFLNSMRLKGIHLALKSGVMAARTAFQALAVENYSAAMLSGYEKQFRASWAHKELWSVRNFHQGYEGGLVSGALHTAAQMVTGGRGFTARLKAKPDHLHMKKLSELPEARQPIQRKFDGVLTFDKPSDVFASGTKHEENQPPHLKVLDTNICVDRCTTEYGNPCQYFCPAQVYEMVEVTLASPPAMNNNVGADLSRTGASEIQNPKSKIQNRLRLQINASNCVHCKTCDIADPYGIITWTVPEGGGGPVYGGM
jgi:electron-transferring-flavoprotein dehydrogenase